jgi:hypothetical protein
LFLSFKTFFCVCASENYGNYDKFVIWGTTWFIRRLMVKYGILLSQWVKTPPERPSANNKELRDIWLREEEGDEGPRISR